MAFLINTLTAGALGPSISFEHKGGFWNRPKAVLKICIASPCISSWRMLHALWRIMSHTGALARPSL